MRSRNRKDGASDGTNYLHFHTEDGSDTGCCRYGGNDPIPILDAIAEHCEVEYLSEHDEGFYTEEEEAYLEGEEPDGE